MSCRSSRHQHLAGKLLGGWQITGVSQFQTGTPFTVATARRFAGVGTGAGSPALERQRRYRLPGRDVLRRVGRLELLVPDASRWFSDFHAARARHVHLEAQPQGFCTIPGSRTGISAYSRLCSTEQHRINSGFEAFNWLNHPNWGGANRNPRSANFGKVTDKSSQRNLQLTLRYSF